MNIRKGAFIGCLLLLGVVPSNARRCKVSPRDVRVQKLTNRMFWWWVAKKDRETIGGAIAMHGALKGLGFLLWQEAVMVRSMEQLIAERRFDLCMGLISYGMDLHEDLVRGLERSKRWRGRYVETYEQAVDAYERWYAEKWRGYCEQLVPHAKSKQMGVLLREMKRSGRMEVQDWTMFATGVVIMLALKQRVRQYRQS